MDIKSYIKNHMLFLDGGMGTQLQENGLELGGIPEMLNFTNPELITSIHRRYIDAGSDIVYTNSFGANRFKMSHTDKSVSEIIKAAIKNAKKATEGTNALVALDIGPIGQLLEPTGSLKFEEAYDIFKEQIIAGRDDADLIVFETMTDLYELKAGVLAAKENSDLPVFCTMTFEENMRTFTGCCIPSMAMTLEGLGVDAIGINCSLGPRELLPLVEELRKHTSLPLIVKPNAGLPDPVTNKYEITPEDFDYLTEQLGVVGNDLLRFPEADENHGDVFELIRTSTSTVNGVPSFSKKKVANKEVVSITIKEDWVTFPYGRESGYQLSKESDNFMGFQESKDRKERKMRGLDFDKYKKSDNGFIPNPKLKIEDGNLVVVNADDFDETITTFKPGIGYEVYGKKNGKQSGLSFIAL